MIASPFLEIIIHKYRLNIPYEWIKTLIAASDCTILYIFKVYVDPFC